jgi:hypothetical protein
MYANHYSSFSPATLLVIRISDKLTMMGTPHNSSPLKVDIDHPYEE